MLAYRRRLVTPGLVAHTLREEAVRAADSDVEYQVERLVERRVLLPARRPWVIESRIVHQLLAEATAVPHELVELEEEDLLCPCQNMSSISSQQYTY